MTMVKKIFVSILIWNKLKTKFKSESTYIVWSQLRTMRIKENEPITNKINIERFHMPTGMRS